MQTTVLGLLLAAVFVLFAAPVQRRLQKLLRRTPQAVWAAPFLLTALFAGAAAMVGVFRPALAAMVLVYASAPVLCAYLAGPGPATQPGALDFAAILLLWLPLEFGAGQNLVPRAAQGFLHSAGYGIAILLALILFLGFRAFAGLKYNPPRQARDWRLPLVGFALVAPVLAVVGIAIGFIPPPHLPTRSAASMAAAAGVIFAGTALPEEIIFR
jgi:hypothetical protein